MDSGRIEISIEEYHAMKDAIKAHEKVEAKLAKQVESLQEKLACHTDAIQYLNQIGFWKRMFNWNAVLDDVIDLSKNGVSLNNKENDTKNIKGN